jgi:hypothetical protein
LEQFCERFCRQTIGALFGQILISVFLFPHFCFFVLLLYFSSISNIWIFRVVYFWIPCFQSRSVGSSLFELFYLLLLDQHMQYRFVTKWKSDLLLKDRETFFCRHHHFKLVWYFDEIFLQCLNASIFDLHSLSIQWFIWPQCSCSQFVLFMATLCLLTRTLGIFS